MVADEAITIRDLNSQSENTEVKELIARSKEEKKTAFESFELAK